MDESGGDYVQKDDDGDAGNNCSDVFATVRRRLLKSIIDVAGYQ